MGFVGRDRPWSYVDFVDEVGLATSKRSVHTPLSNSALLSYSRPAKHLLICDAQTPSPVTIAVLVISMLNFRRVAHGRLYVSGRRCTSVTGAFGAAKR
jgi:hypothetical protein